MAVYIYEEDAFEKMVQIEGEEFVKYQELAGPWSFNSFLKAWRAIPESVRKAAPDWGVSIDGHGAIYGLHGWNRYTVRYSGEIWFIELMAGRKSDIEKAREVGFRIV